MDELEVLDDFEITSLTERADIEKALPEVLHLIDLSYEVYYGSTKPEKLLRSTSLIQAVYRDGSMIAATLCRGMDESHKISAICCDQTDQGKAALRFIIHHNIEFFQDWVWAEVSGSIEHYYKKFKGYPIPNCYAALVLEKPQESLQLDPDGFHYTRRIGESDPIKKVIFGFRDKATMDKVLAKVDYEICREKFNLSDEVLESFKYGKEMKWASSFINQLSDLNDEHEIEELSPQLKAHLEKAIAILQGHVETAGWIKRECEFGKFLLKDIPPMRMGTFKEVL